MANLKYLRTTSAALILSGMLCALAFAQKPSTTADPAAAQTDLRITYDVMQSFAKHSDLGPPNRIYVNTRDRVVYLTGTVTNSLAADNAKDVARKVSGVTDVVSTISTSK